MCRAVWMPASWLIDVGAQQWTKAKSSICKQPGALRTRATPVRTLHFVDQHDVGSSRGRCFFPVLPAKLPLTLVPSDSSPVVHDYLTPFSSNQIYPSGSPLFEAAGYSIWKSWRMPQPRRESPVKTWRRAEVLFKRPDSCKMGRRVTFQLWNKSLLYTQHYPISECRMFCSLVTRFWSRQLGWKATASSMLWPEVTHSKSYTWQKLHGLRQGVGSLAHEARNSAWARMGKDLYLG